MKVLTAISRYNMLAPGDRVAAAVSGGPDSVCLLHALLEMAPRLGFTVAAVAHFNHKLRGEASEEDERFVAALAAHHGVPFLCERAAVAEADGNLEQAARRARHAFFSRLIREGMADRVATGHTSDDQAETVLFRLLRGSGLAGLAGILPVTREGLIRPMLDVTRAEVEEFLRTRGHRLAGRCQQPGRALRAQPDQAQSSAAARAGVESSHCQDAGASGGSGARGGTLVAGGNLPPGKGSSRRLRRGHRGRSQQTRRPAKSRSPARHSPSC